MGLVGRDSLTVDRGEIPVVSEVLKVPVRPDWSEIDHVREATGEFLRARGFHAETVDAVAMVLSELLENANKYGVFVDDEMITVRLSVYASSIIVEVQNPVAEEAAPKLAVLDRTVQWIRSFQDPFQAYVERVRVVSGQDLYSKESGLGLVRIAYEGRSLIDFYVDRDQTLTVSAVHLL